MGASGPVVRQWYAGVSKCRIRPGGGERRRGGGTVDGVRPGVMGRRTPLTPFWIRILRGSLASVGAMSVCLLTLPTAAGAAADLGANSAASASSRDSSGSVDAQGPSLRTVQEARPLGQALRPDGSLRATSGSFDAHGYHFQLMADGAPRFVPATTSTKWSENFGASGATNSVQAVAVAGTNVYIGTGITTSFGGINYNHVAKWDCHGWQTLGSGLTTALRRSGSSVRMSSSAGPSQPPDRPLSRTWPCGTAPPGRASTEA
jgi:hypothetical protein